MGKIQEVTNPKKMAVPASRTMQAYVKSMEKEIAKALPAVMTPERFTRIVLSALSSTPKLAATTKESFLGAMMTAAQLGLEPNTPLGQAYLIPYGNKCQFQLGYKGLIDLAYRSGEVSIIQAQTVYEHDSFSFEYGLEPTLKHVPARENRGEPIYFYAIFKMKNGGYGFEVMSKEDVLKHARKFSKTFGDGPWQTNFEEMAKKTVLKKVLKYAPLKSDFLRGLAQDETIKEEISEDMSTVPSTYIEVESEVVSTETGEVTHGNADHDEYPNFLKEEEVH